MLALLVVITCLSCVELESDPVVDEAAEAASEDGEALPEVPELEPPTPPSSAQAPARRARGPWLGEADDVAKRYPAFGVTTYHMAHVFDAPKRGARAVGYLRRGARFRASEEISRRDCARGWFEVSGGGFVCNGDGVAIDSRAPAYEDSPLLPALSDPLPYPYRKVVAGQPAQFLRLPTVQEEQAVNATLANLPSDAGVDADAGVPLFPSLLRMRMQPGFYVSVDRELEDTLDARRFFRTVRGGLVRAEQLVEAKQPQGLGVTLGERFSLPMAFVYRGGAPILRKDPVTGELVKVGGDWPVHSAHSLTGESLVKAGRRYFVTKDGLLLRDTAIRIVDKLARPKLVPRNERWIRVDLDRQTLTAYEGEVPVFATLVSSGLPDHATPTGLFRLHAKHVTTTMADDLATDGPYSIEDVPWTMYFLGSYALHAAFWHERFGHPRSHGCVNLAPRDARWLFFWTLPELPSAWHGVLAGVGEGTSVLLDTGVPYAIEQGS
ncbi:MAG: L,D-transpeptidase [Myxococcales bacterium]